MTDKPQTPNDVSDSMKGPSGQSIDQTRAQVAARVSKKLDQRSIPKEEDRP
jgi:hypothetical protein